MSPLLARIFPQWECRLLGHTYESACWPDACARCTTCGHTVHAPHEGDPA